MANVTTCTICGALYEATAEETANEPHRTCAWCSAARRDCPGCGRVMSAREAAEQGICNDCEAGEP